jgi:hypothetical protein
METEAGRESDLSAEHSENASLSICRSFEPGSKTNDESFQKELKHLEGSTSTDGGT